MEMQVINIINTTKTSRGEQSKKFYVLFKEYCLHLCQSFFALVHLPVRSVSLNPGVKQNKHSTNKKLFLLDKIIYFLNTCSPSPRRWKLI